MYDIYEDGSVEVAARNGGGYGNSERKYSI